MCTDYDRRENLPPCIAVAPPCEVRSVRIRSGHIQIPQGEVAQEIGDFIIVAYCEVVFFSAAAIVYQRGTGLCGGGFETGVIAPGYVP